MQFFEDSFWGRVKQRLWANGMSLRTLAKRLNEPYSSFTNRVAEGRVPKKSGLVEAIAKELGCSAEYLITGKENPQSTSGYGPDIENLIFKYRFLSEEKKNAVRLLMDALETQQEKENDEYKREHPELF